jgi:phage shock protein A
VQRVQDKVLQMQARASAMDELIQSGTLQEIGPGGTDEIDRQLGAIKDHDEVDRQLDAIKAAAQIPSSAQQSLRLSPGEASPQQQSGQ